MTKLSLDEYRSNRVTDLMNQFFQHLINFRKEVDKGTRFLDCTHHQAKAAEVLHMVDEEGLLYLAQELYSWEKERIKDYLEIYKEIQSGVKI